MDKRAFHQIISKRVENEWETVWISEGKFNRAFKTMALSKLFSNIFEKIEPLSPKELEEVVINIELHSPPETEEKNA